MAMKEDEDLGLTGPRAGLCRVTAVLSYNGVLSFLSNGLTAIAIPSQLSIFAPKKTALLSGLLLGCGAFIQATSPIVGHFADLLGRRPVIVCGAFLVLAGESMLLTGVYTWSKDNGGLGFTIYFVGYLVIQVGTVLMSTCFNALVADLSSEMPSKAGRVASIYGLYGLTGATFSYAAAGALFPVTSTNHNFYWFCVGLTVLSTAALLTSIDQAPPPPTSPPSATTTSTTVSLPPLARGLAKALARALEVLALWCGSEAYKPWRRVVLSRGLYFFACGVFGSDALYFLFDCTDSTDPPAQFTLIALCSLTGSFLAAWPAGKLSDAYGSYPCVFVAGILMGAVFGLIPLLTSITVFFFVIPFYGMAQQVYNVADLAMITAVLPDPEKRARDMGGWACFDSIGSAIGAVFGGVVLTLVGDSGETVAESRDDDQLFGGADDDGDDDDGAGKRTRYSRAGYMAVFWPAASAVILASLLLYPIRHRLRVVNDTDDDGGNDDDHDGKRACQVPGGATTAPASVNDSGRTYEGLAGDSNGQKLVGTLESSAKSPLLDANDHFF